MMSELSEVFRANGLLLIERIGRGSFGEIYKAQDLKTHEIKAIKQVITNEPIHLSEKILGLNNKYLITYYDCFNWNYFGFIGTELCNGGNLEDWLAEQAKIPDEDTVFNWSMHLLRGISYLHSDIIDLIHGDVQPRNVFIQNNQLKLGDLAIDIVKYVDTNKKIKPTFTGNHNYMSPEMINDKNIITNRIDIWSFGCVLYELCTLRKVFPGSTAYVVYDKILNYEPSMPNLNPIFKYMIYKSLEKNPNNRDSAELLLALLQEKS